MAKKTGRRKGSKNKGYRRAVATSPRQPKRKRRQKQPSKEYF